MSRAFWDDIEERLRAEPDLLTLPVGSVSWDEEKGTCTFEAYAEPLKRCDCGLGPLLPGEGRMIVDARLRQASDAVGEEKGGGSDTAGPSWEKPVAFTGIPLTPEEVTQITSKRGGD